MDRTADGRALRRFSRRCRWGYGLLALVAGAWVCFSFRDNPRMLRFDALLGAVLLAAVATGWCTGRLAYAWAGRRRTVWPLLWMPLAACGCACLATALAYWVLLPVLRMRSGLAYRVEELPLVVVGVLVYALESWPVWVPGLPLVTWWLARSRRRMGAST